MYQFEKRKCNTKSRLSYLLLKLFNILHFNNDKMFLFSCLPPCTLARTKIYKHKYGLKPVKVFLQDLRRERIKSYHFFMYFRWENYMECIFWLNTGVILIIFKINHILNSIWAEFVIWFDIIFQRLQSLIKHCLL